MGRKFCAMKACPSRKRTHSGTISFHKFPNKTQCEEVYNRWCEITGIIPNNHTIICSLHFHSVDFLTKEGTKKHILKPTAVPSHYLSETAETQRRVLADHSYSQQWEPIEKCDDELQLMFRQKCFELERANKKIKELQQLLIERSNFIAKPTKEYLMEHVTPLLEPYLTKQQISAIVTGAKKVHEWNEEDIKRAIGIRLRAPRCYRYLRINKLMVLPALDSLRKRTKPFNLLPGDIDKMCFILKEKLKDKTPEQRVAVLAYDDMYTDKAYEYDPSADMVLQPNSSGTMNGMIVRGLFDSWKFPLRYSFGDKLTGELLNEIILKLDNIGVDVAWCASDRGPDNKALNGEHHLKTTTERPYFEHPKKDGRLVFTSYDPPHLVKALRTNVLNGALILPSGNAVMDREKFQRLLDCDKSDEGMAYKLSVEHLDANADSQKVRLAVQMFSNSVASAMESLFPEDPVMMEVAIVTRQTNN